MLSLQKVGTCLTQGDHDLGPMMINFTVQNAHWWSQEAGRRWTQPSRRSRSP